MEYPRREYTVYNRPVFVIGEPVPLVGHIAFGIIDRGTNVLQVRPSTLCPHSCIFCSVDAGPRSRWRATEYLVDSRWLLRWISDIASLKGGGVEVLLDGVGEPLSHPGILEIIRGASSLPSVRTVALETHGGFLSKKLLEELCKAGLSRINLSIDTLDPQKARRLAGIAWYDVRRIASLVEWAFENTCLDFVLTPVVIPGINEDDMVDLIEWAKSVGFGSKIGWPTGVLIQKYEAHRYGRRPAGIKEWTWSRFYEWLRRLEERTGYKLIVSMRELGMRIAPRLPKPYRVGDIVITRILGPGWLKGELLAVDLRMERIITVIDAPPVNPGKRLRVRIIRDKDNIYLARA